MPALLLIALQIAAPVTVAPQSSSSIIFYRSSTVVGAVLGCPIRYKGKEIVELGRGKFAEWRVAPGRYIVNNKTSSLEVTVEAGETRYVRCEMKAGLLTGRADLQIVDAESFRQHASDYKPKPLNEGF